MRKMDGLWPNEHPICPCIDHRGLHLSLWHCGSTGASWIYWYVSDPDSDAETWPSKRVDFGPFDSGSEVIGALQTIVAEYAQHHLA